MVTARVIATRAGMLPVKYSSPGIRIERSSGVAPQRIGLSSIIVRLPLTVRGVRHAALLHVV